MPQKLTNTQVDNILPNNIKRIGEIIDSKTKIEWFCKICNYLWITKPNHILSSKSGCPRCKQQLKLTDIEIDNRLLKNKIKIKRIDSICGGNNQTKINWRCLKCEHVWLNNACKIINGIRGCPKCNESRGEKEIRKILNILNIVFETQKTFKGCKNKILLRFDFYLPKYKICELA